jgi:hypothetical protein
VGYRAAAAPDYAWDHRHTKLDEHSAAHEARCAGRRPDELAGRYAWRRPIPPDARARARGGHRRGRSAQARVRGTASLAAQLVGEQNTRFSELVQTHADTLGLAFKRPLEQLSPRQAAQVAGELRSLNATTSGLRAAALVSPARRLVAYAPPVPRLCGHSFAGRDWYRGVTAVRSPCVSRVFLAADGPKTVTVAARGPNASSAITKSSRLWQGVGPGPGRHPPRRPLAIAFELSQRLLVEYGSVANIDSRW